MSEQQTSETAELSVQELAKLVAQCFDYATRGNTGNYEDRFVRITEGSPVWVREMVREAHGDMLPDDWKYACVSAACEWIHDTLEAGGDAEDARGEFAESQVDVYNGQRLAWLASHSERVSYTDWAVEEFGRNDPAMGVLGDIAMGQYAEASEVYGIVLQFLEARAA